ncbi:50S ribosomal protein L30 [Halorubellus sp. JP-L1]|uniref:50S ribosomal protein L30 n=1 Tax=Halorubellus sp. JP-L1 TaxID=2715753 RepID=UPI00140D6A58|nr:50S ribosomal protein L30 [Halorubellus sp. JP-L1]NHN41247.1 50S ribosomal protein L30 [Halorubellus sp. JP-L1]
MKAVVQLRGEVDMAGDIKDTLEMLNVHEVNHCALVPETESYRGMLTKVNDYVAMGEPSADVLATILSTRAEPLEGDADVDADYLAEHTEFEDFESLAAALIDEETTLREQGLAPCLRLHPPRKGHDGGKHPKSRGGAIGKHETTEIDELLEAMR